MTAKSAKLAQGVCVALHTANLKLLMNCMLDMFSMNDGDFKHFLLEDVAGYWLSLNGQPIKPVETKFKDIDRWKTYSQNGAGLPSKGCFIHGSLIPDQQTYLLLCDMISVRNKIHIS